MAMIGAALSMTLPGFRAKFAIDPPWVANTAIHFAVSRTDPPPTARTQSQPASRYAAAPVSASAKNVVLRHLGKDRKVGQTVTGFRHQTGFRNSRVRHDQRLGKPDPREFVPQRGNRARAEQRPWKLKDRRHFQVGRMTSFSTPRNVLWISRLISTISKDATRSRKARITVSISSFARFRPAHRCVP